MEPSAHVTSELRVRGHPCHSGKLRLRKRAKKSAPGHSAGDRVQFFFPTFWAPLAAISGLRGLRNSKVPRASAGALWPRPPLQLREGGAGTGRMQDEGNCRRRLQLVASCSCHSRQRKKNLVIFPAH